MKRLLACAVLLASAVTQADAPVCGNHVVDAGETCDDGNRISGDGCDATCHREPVCGDGTIDVGEACDDGNRDDGDGCDHLCQIEPTVPVCGNGIKEAGEDCDDGNLRGHDSCDATCHIERGCCCGNGEIDPGEECDTGDDINGDGCTSGCKIDPMWAAARERLPASATILPFIEPPDQYPRSESVRPRDPRQRRGLLWQGSGTAPGSPARRSHLQTSRRDHAAGTAGADHEHPRRG
jgi:cysteine-rich repeat protein